MFRKILVANRGEIALRILRACRELGIKTVAVYSEPDRESPHVAFADEAFCIGPAAAAESYLHIPNLISAAELTEADAIHPGYGFLSENATFAGICRDHHLTFIGPPPEVIDGAGNKARAREVMISNHVPVLPGSVPLDDLPAAVLAGRKLGYPVLLKAAGGGGGKGMRLFRDEAELNAGFAAARHEAKSAFGNDTVYLEKFLARARHIEFQVIADAQGNVVHLWERDCSLQRRHQKLVEESPAPLLPEAVRVKAGELAVRAMKAVSYVNAGTVEFIVDEHFNFYFMEINSRVQVEHPVTEMVTGIDIVRTQIEIAAGKPLPFRQEDVTRRGHAFEVRLCAEDPSRNYLPDAGTIERLHWPLGPGIRIDTHVHEGYQVPQYYDSMLGKLVVCAETREAAVARMERALSEIVIDGVRTTLPLFRKVFADPEFRAGRVYTGFLTDRA